ncbi:MAG: hypothetical protein AMJ62_05755 [Myxococcales bacterium SG8_38]|nr:MAG: hypothetical protein AMJ62_05755 [Myxococcales bacterium SG8_38]
MSCATPFERLIAAKTCRRERAGLLSSRSENCDTSWPPQESPDNAWATTTTTTPRAHNQGRGTSATRTTANRNTARAPYRSMNRPQLGNETNFMTTTAKLPAMYSA